MSIYESPVTVVAFMAVKSDIIAFMYVPSHWVAFMNVMNHMIANMVSQKRLLKIMSATDFNDVQTQIIIFMCYGGIYKCPE